jgi:hypothetical protein
VFRDKEEFEIDGSQIILLHVAVKIVEELAVDFVEIFANNDPHFVLLRRDNIDNLLEDFVPQELRIAAQEGHVNFVMDVAYLEEIGLLVEIHADLFLVFQFTGAEKTKHFQHLRVFADTRGAIEYHVF